MLNTYYLDLDIGSQFSTASETYSVVDSIGRLKSITNPLHSSGVYGFDYCFDKNIEIKTISFKLLGLEGSRIHKLSNCSVDLYQKYNPFFAPYGTYPVYYDYNKNKWITDVDIQNPDLALDDYLINSTILTDYDRIFPLNKNVFIERKDHSPALMLYRYSLYISISSINDDPAALVIDTTNADVLYNGRNVILRCYLEIEE